LAGQRSKAARGVHPALFYGMFAVLFAGNVAAGTALYLSPDITRLMSGRTDEVIEAYEGRIAQMRVEIDRLQSRSYAQAGDINLQLQELSQQQEVLFEQHQLVKVLVEKADSLGIAAADILLDPITEDVAADDRQFQHGCDRDQPRTDDGRDAYRHARHSPGGQEPDR
jgi:hypothetical protein